MSNVLLRRWLSTKWLEIGNVRARIVSSPKHPELVPVVPLPPPPDSLLQHLQWMIRKDQLGQDMFLLGPPGSARRKLAFQYAALTQREVEYLPLTRDATEADLKQRREIVKGSMQLVNQSAVRAAIEGRLLILEGIEKAERNVLPILNNLLENREVNLEDGRRLIAPKRYDELLKNHTLAELQSWNLVRVSENFRVIALGLPCPPYPGAPLDPPFRSRFQVRFFDLVEDFDYEYEIQRLSNVAPAVPLETIKAIVLSYQTFLTVRATNQSSSDVAALGGSTIPPWPQDAPENIAMTLQRFPDELIDVAIRQTYPHILPKAGLLQMDSVLQRFFKLGPNNKEVESLYRLDFVRRIDEGRAVATFKHSEESSTSSKTTAEVEIRAGDGTVNGSIPHFFSSNHHQAIITQLIQAHAQGDVCLFGPRGIGKTLTVMQFAAYLGYTSLHIPCYRDMTARDLLVRRATMSDQDISFSSSSSSSSYVGDTHWVHSPLVTGALRGHLVVLDGIEQLSPGTLAALQALWVDRHLELPDGTRLVGATVYEKLSKDQADLTAKGILRIHPSFRVIAVAGEPGGEWLTEEVASLFQFVYMRPPTLSDQQALLKHLTTCPPHHLDPLLKFAEISRQKQHEEHSGSLPSASTSQLSTRQLVRIARRLAAFGEESLRQALLKSTLWPFLPPMQRSALLTMLDEAGVQKPSLSSSLLSRLEPPTISRDDDSGLERVHIGYVSAARYQPQLSSKALVPSITYHDNSQHTQILRDMLVDFNMGEHLLLIGNQGVGKNKLADRFLQLLQRPREYIQLHRDTTVQALMVHATIEQGRIVYQDAPLVRAARLGHVLVIDEADKAPVHVTAALKSLAETGEMLLSDGRYIRPSAKNSDVDPLAIQLHPDFRMIVLANRPGWPFLGNDFYSTIGDVFATHAVENPDAASELGLLSKEAPLVSRSVLQRLVGVFGDLRLAFNEGLVAYPYSLRELVAIARHLNTFPNDSFTNALRNVFDFDAHTKDFDNLLLSILRKHGFPLHSLRRNVMVDSPNKSIKLAATTSLPSPSLSPIGTWQQHAVGEPIASSKDTVKIGNPRHIDQKIEANIGHFNARLISFSEQVASFNVPHLGRGGRVLAAASAAATTSDDLETEEGGSGSYLHAVVGDPVNLYSFKLSSAAIPMSSVYSNLAEVFGYGKTQGIVHIAAYGTKGEVALFAPALSILAFVDTEGASARAVTLSFPSTKRTTTSSSSSASSGLSLVSTNSDGPCLLVDRGSSRVLVVPLKDINTGHWLDIGSLGLLQALKSNCLIETNPLTWSLLQLEKSQSSFILTKHHTLEMSQQLSPIANGMTELPSLASSPLPLDHPAITNWRAQTDAFMIVQPDDSDTLKGICPVPSTVESVVDRESILVTYPTTTTHLSNAKSTFHAAANLFVSATPTIIQAVDMNNGTLKSVEVTTNASDSKLTPILTPLETGQDGHIASITPNGLITIWQLNEAALQRDLAEWERLNDEDDNDDGDDSNASNSEKARRKSRKSFKKLRIITIEDNDDDNERETSKSNGSNKPLKGPKHGEEDDEEHHGGNTFAGGTGGRDTAGMGGRGGPYRIDKGFKIHQISDEEKAKVPKEVQEAARAMGQKALKERLRELEMKDDEREVYTQLLNSVSREIQQLRVIFQGAQAREQERVWLRNRTDGDLDDARLVDSIAGEPAVFKKRGVEDNVFGIQQQKPKRFRFVFDLSASMYRFNGMDGRLERSLAAAVLLMEALDAVDKRRVTYEITGHSGDEPRITLTHQDNPPMHAGARAKVVLQMLAHTQYTWSGDNTLTGTQQAIREISQVPGDDHIVVVLSDANLERYGVDPRQLSRVMTSDARVKVYILFIGSLGEQAQQLISALPPGRAFLCLDPAKIPGIFSQILAASVNKQA